jgi:hypothetical protein
MNFGVDRLPPRHGSLPGGTRSENARRIVIIGISIGGRGASARLEHPILNRFIATRSEISCCSNEQREERYRCTSILSLREQDHRRTESCSKTPRLSRNFLIVQVPSGDAKQAVLFSGNSVSLYPPNTYIQVRGYGLPQRRDGKTLGRARAHLKQK